MSLSTSATIAFAALALTTSLASAQPVVGEPTEPAEPVRVLGYVGANIIPDGQNPAEYSVEGGFRIARSPVFAHAELGTTAYLGAAGLELRGCSRRSEICGAAGVDAAYAVETGQLDPVARIATDVGGAFRFRIGVDVPVSRDGNTITPHDVQLKLGLARTF